MVAAATILRACAPMSAMLAPPAEPNSAIVRALAVKQTRQPAWHLKATNL